MNFLNNNFIQNNPEAQNNKKGAADMKNTRAKRFAKPMRAFAGFALAASLFTGVVPTVPFMEPAVAQAAIGDYRSANDTFLVSSEAPNQAAVIRSAGGSAYVRYTFTVPTGGVNFTYADLQIPDGSGTILWNDSQDPPYFYINKRLKEISTSGTTASGAEGVINFKTDGYALAEGDTFEVRLRIKYTSANPPVLTLRLGEFAEKFVPPVIPDPTDPTDPSEDPTDPSEDPTDPSEDPTDPTDPTVPTGPMTPGKDFETNIRIVPSFPSAETDTDGKTVTVNMPIQTELQYTDVKIVVKRNTTASDLVSGTLEVKLDGEVLPSSDYEVEKSTDGQTFTIKLGDRVITSNSNLTMKFRTDSADYDATYSLVSITGTTPGGNVDPTDQYTEAGEMVVSTGEPWHKTKRAVRAECQVEQNYNTQLIPAGENGYLQLSSVMVAIPADSSYSFNVGDLIPANDPRIKSEFATDGEYYELPKYPGQDRAAYRLSIYKTDIKDWVDEYPEYMKVIYDNGGAKRIKLYLDPAFRADGVSMYQLNGQFLTPGTNNCEDIPVSMTGYGQYVPGEPEAPVEPEAPGNPACKPMEQSPVQKTAKANYDNRSRLSGWRYGDGRTAWDVSNSWYGDANLNTFQDPYYGSGYKAPAGYTRQPKRELTSTEIERGHSVYITSSQPSDPSRYYSQLYRTEPALQDGQELVHTPIGSGTGWIINALAFNEQDNWLYAISQPRVGGNRAASYIKGEGERLITYNTDDPCYPAGHLLQINPVTGEIYDLGKVTGRFEDGYGFQNTGMNSPMPSWTIPTVTYEGQDDLWTGINAGVIGNGKMYVANASSEGTRAMYTINLPEVRSYGPSASTPYGFGTVCGRNYYPDDYCDQELNGGGDKLKDHRMSAEDYAYVVGKDGEGYLVGIVNNRLRREGGVSAWIERIDAATGDVVHFPLSSSMTSPGGNELPNTSSIANWGQAWTYGDGSIGISMSSEYQKPTTLKISFEDITAEDPKFALDAVGINSTTAYNTNATSTGLSNPVDLVLNKARTVYSVDPTSGKGSITWSISVKNVSESASSGSTFIDSVPSYYRNVKIVSVTTPVDNDYMIEVGNFSGKQYGPVGNTVHIFLGKIGAQETATITLSAEFGATDEKCVLNRADVTPFEGDKKPEDNWDEDECPEDVTIRVIKIAPTEEKVELDGAEFAVYKPAADGTFDPNGEVIPVNLDKGTTNEYRFDLTTGGIYYLVETKAPKDQYGRQYELLAEPVRFEVKIEKNAAGKSLVTIETDPDVLSVKTKNSEYYASTDSIQLASITVADIYTGTLPMTGGRGVGLYGLAGMVLFGMAFFMGRRKQMA